MEFASINPSNLLLKVSWPGAITTFRGECYHRVSCNPIHLVIQFYSGQLYMCVFPLPELQLQISPPYLRTSKGTFSQHWVLCPLRDLSFRHLMLKDTFPWGISPLQLGDDQIFLVSFRQWSHFFQQLLHGLIPWASLGGRLHSFLQIYPSSTF